MQRFEKVNVLTGLLQAELHKNNPSHNIFLCAELVLFLANKVVDKSSFMFHVERNLLGGEKVVVPNSVSAFLSSAKEAPELKCYMRA